MINCSEKNVCMFACFCFYHPPHRITATLFKHCLRQNGPEGWVQLTKVNCLGHNKFQLKNRDQAANSKFQPNISIPTKLKLQNLDLTSKSCLNFEILTKPCAQTLNKKLTFWASASKSATKCCQHISHHQHQQQQQPQQVLSCHLHTPKSHQSSLLNGSFWVRESVSYWQG